jgi:hypothetical protein
MKHLKSTFFNPMKLLLSLSLVLSTLGFALNAQVMFDGSPGTSAPPATLGSYLTVPFGEDSRPLFNNVSEVGSPLGGNITFSAPLSHRRIGSGWFSWSHGYAGDVYYNADPTATITINLPSGTRAFYLYAEPDQFANFTIEAVANDGTTSGPVTVSGVSGATYFGFYINQPGSRVLTSVSISADPAANGFAIGEFGIAACNPGYTTHALACNDNSQLSISPELNVCEAAINLDMILEGTSDVNRGLPCDVKYGRIEVKSGNRTVHISDPLTYLDENTTFDASAYLGRTLTTKVIYYDFNDNIVNQCWGSITLEDKARPEIICEVELLDPKTGVVLQSGDVINIDCTIDPELIAAPIAEDNCDPSPNVNLINETVVGDVCGVRTIRRTYRATDASGNESDPCTITINVTQADVTFPDDITWTCEQYLQFPNIVNAEALHMGIMMNADIIDRADYCCIPGLDGDDVIGVAPYGAGAYWLDAEDLDVNLDPEYDDNLDNPLTDPNAFQCGTPSNETDSYDDVFNLSVLVGCPYNEECEIPGLHNPTIVTVPLYQPADPLGLPIRGLEDRDILEMTGSGVPNVFGYSDCKYAVTYSDQVIEACEGVDPSEGIFKILRRWSVLNWCTGQTTIDIQVIKVLDKKAPTIVFNDDDDNDGIPDETETNERFGNDDGFNDQLYSNEFTSGPHPECASHGFLDVPEYYDNCSGAAEIRVFTPAGEGIPVYNAGNLIGFRIPSPYLPMGVHTVTYQVTDGCGNTTSVEKRVEVIDGIPPIPICREVTQVALSSDIDGLTEVGAKYFDEGSYDNCGPVYFKVRRMDNFCAGYPDDRNRFNDEVRFCCSDVGNTVNVILRVYDVEPNPGPVTQNYLVPTNNTNDCMIEVLVEDKARPTCAAPANVWTTCADIPANVDLSDTTQLQNLFGNAAGQDNCVAFTEELNPNVDVDLCGVGQVTRRFRARDASGNISIGTCQQIIMIMEVHSYEIYIPGDFEDECTTVSPDTLDYEEIGCDLLAVNVKEEEFPASANGECKKIIRTYKVINWCEYDGVSPPTIVPRVDLNRDGIPGDGFTPSNPGSKYRANHTLISNGDYVYLNVINDPVTRYLPSTGYYQYEQHIKIFDDTAPELTDTLSGPFCGGEFDEDPCTGEVDLLPLIDETCTDVTVSWQLDAFNDVFQTADFTGDDALTGRYPLGIHTARFRVSDDCGNTSQIDITFEIIDCKAPTPVCHNGLSIDLMPSGMVEIWATDFDASSYDYCHPLKFRINRIEDRNGDGFITADDYLNTVPVQDSIVLRCKDLGITQVQLWVGEESTDNVNNWDYCVTFIEVQDNLGACNGSRGPIITGVTKSTKGDPVEGVNVAMSGSLQQSMTTISNGAFAFGNLVTGNDYTITPSKLDDMRNGVSTFDLTFIAKHVLNVKLLDDPYKLIAADANNSGSVTTLDMVVLRKLILYVENDLPNNTSWRFVPTSHVFADPANPWGFPEVENFNDIAGDQLANFVAIKVGDVSGDANPSLTGIQNRSYNGTFYFDVNDVNFKAGEEVRVTFTSKELAQLGGYQFTMNFNNKALQLTDIIEGVATRENFGLSMVEEGIITTSWNGSANDEEAFTLVFQANTDATLSTVFHLTSEYTSSEAYSGADLKQVGIRYNTGVTAGNDFELFQNTPNPFRGVTTIGFNLPEATEATLTISDVSGKILRVVQGNFAEGYNMIELNSADFNASGVMYYQLETAKNTATKKLIILE